MVTRDGIWLGRDWLRLSKDQDASAGIIEREESLRETRAEVSRLAEELQALGLSNQRLIVNALFRAADPAEHRYPRRVLR